MPSHTAPCAVRSLAAMAVAVAAAILAAVPCHAQESAPLIREEPQVRVRTSSGSERTNREAAEPQATPTPTPDPATVIVAIVNGHSLTRAQLDRLSRARVGTAPPTRREGEPNRGELLATLGPGGRPLSERARMQLDLTDQQQEFEWIDAKRRVEGELVEEWIEAKMLSDEARRQGFAVSSSEFERRLAEIEEEYLGGSANAARLLDFFGLTPAEFEAFVYEALLIEALCERFVALNISDEELRMSFEKNKQFYRTPERVRAPHFVISLLGDETPQEIAAFERLAEEVRKRLRDGEDPNQVFANPRYSQIERGIVGEDLGFFSIEANTLPPVVAAELRKMKEGDVSRVLKQLVRRDGRVVPESLHVVMLAERLPPTGETFETAYPKLRDASRALARIAVLDLIREARSHRVVTNLGGIPPERVSPPDNMRPAEPVSLLAAKQRRP